MRLADEANYKLIGQYDVTSIQTALPKIDEALWYLDQSRHDPIKNPFHSHKESRSVFLYDVDTTWRGGGYPIQKKSVDSELEQYTDLIIHDLEKKYQGRVGKCLYINLPAGKQVKHHVDVGWYLTRVHRCHVPIFTAEEVSFIIGGESLNMKQGMCYEINNQKVHGVDNFSSIDRVHLLIDIIPNNHLPLEYQL
jgi:hypothetical protein